MKRIRIIQGLSGLVALAGVAVAQTSTSTSMGFAPVNFGDVILTSTPSNATGNSGVSTVYSSSGNQFTFGTGGTLVNPMNFNYSVTGPNTATLAYPATDTAPATTTNLVFNNTMGGTYTTTSGTTTTTGNFSLAAIPNAAPISNVSARTTITPNGNTIIGFVISGSMPRRVLIRAVGPGLAAFGVANPLQNPMISLYRGQDLVATNDDWGTLMTSTGATSGGTSSGTSSGSTGTTSSGSTSGTGTGTTTGSMSGTGTGTTGSATGITWTTNADGSMTGTAADGTTFTTQMATAQDFTNAGAFALTTGSQDSAIVATLPPGAYTIMVSASTAAATSTGTSSGTGSTATTSTASTSTGTTSGTSTSGTSTTSTSSTSTSSTSTTGTSSTGTGTTTTTSTAGSGDALVEVYFVQ